ncbi:hypothetical protein HOLleu_21422 [Holothuria leucospilota]|uniref:Uncharacterized protein n=1 Tax=Holothuria leucospilota TaxID=206669 RepID=A0A9Q1BXF5_HOLLE|nr:hypothetical protein HOLleu_21422 [Holothuria leucospilota]
MQLCRTKKRQFHQSERNFHKIDLYALRGVYKLLYYGKSKTIISLITFIENDG